MQKQSEELVVKVENLRKTIDRAPTPMVWSVLITGIQNDKYNLF